MKLRCQRCKRVWDYKGTNKYDAPCSGYETSVSIRKAMLRDGHERQQRG